MKIRNVVFGSILLFACTASYAQVVSDIKPSASGKMGEFTEWKQADVSFDDGTKATIEYRIALATRKGIGCHYDLEVKNTSSITLTVTMEALYFDKLVKRKMSEEAKEKLKAGKSVVARLIAQGCRKEKGSDADDYASCLACEFGASIYVSK